jgi:hypothetical protein
MLLIFRFGWIVARDGKPFKGKDCGQLVPEVRGRGRDEMRDCAIKLNLWRGLTPVQANRRHAV